MRIRVLETHNSVRTDGRYIHPGEYDIHDPALFECGGYLIAEGVAVRVETEPAEEFIFEAAPEVEAEVEPVKPSHKKGKK